MVPDVVPFLLQLDVRVAWAALFLATPVYLALYAYLDAIMPNNFGIRQSCCFCVKRRANASPRTEVIREENSAVTLK